MCVFRQPKVDEESMILESWFFGFVISFSLIIFIRNKGEKNEKQEVVYDFSIGMNYVKSL